MKRQIFIKKRTNLKNFIGDLMYFKTLWMRLIGKSKTVNTRHNSI